MNKAKKKEILLKNFEILKDNFEKNHSSLGDLVGNMFDVDIDMAIEMWKFLLTKYKAELNGEHAYSITGSVIFKGIHCIDDETMHNLILNTPEIKQALFSYSKEETSCCSIIADQIASDKLTLTNELLDLLYNNSTMRQSWPWETIMFWSISFLEEYTNKISEEAFDLLNMWCEKVEDEEERAELMVKLMGFV